MRLVIVFIRRIFLIHTYQNYIMEECNKFAKILSKCITTLASPLFIPSYLVAVMMIFSSLASASSFELRKEVFLLVVVATVGTPLWCYLPYKLISSLYKQGDVSDELYSKEPSYEPYIRIFVALASYLLAVLLIRNYVSLSLALRMFISPVLLVFFCFLMDKLRIYFSLHMAYLTMLSTSLYMFTYYGVGGLFYPYVGSLIFAGVVGSCLLYTRKDVLAGVVTAVLAGIVSTISSFLIGGLFNS